MSDYKDIPDVQLSAAVAMRVMRKLPSEVHVFVPGAEPCYVAMPYATDRNACAEAEAKMRVLAKHTNYIAELVYNIKHDPAMHILDSLHPNDKLLEQDFMIITSSPRQRCVAMLQALDKVERKKG